MIVRILAIGVAGKLSKTVILDFPLADTILSKEMTLAQINAQGSKCPKAKGSKTQRPRIKELIANGQETAAAKPTAAKVVQAKAPPGIVLEEARHVAETANRSRRT